MLHSLFRDLVDLLTCIGFVYIQVMKDSIEKYMNYNLHSDILRCEMVQCCSYLLYDILTYPDLIDILLFNPRPPEVFL